MIIFVLWIMLIIYPVKALSEECTKKIRVQEYIVKTNPNPFVKVKDPKTKGDKKEILISCELYESIKEGDTLESTEIERFRLFSKDRGYLEKKQWEVLKK